MCNYLTSIEDVVAVLARREEAQHVHLARRLQSLQRGESQLLARLNRMAAVAEEEATSRTSAAASASQSVQSA
jgi:hypothetical protein